MRTRMISLEQHLSDSEQAIPADLRDRLENVEASLSRTGDRFEEFTNRIDNAQDHSQLAESTEVADLASIVEQSFVQLTDLTNAIHTEREARTADQQALREQLENDHQTLREQLETTDSRIISLEDSTGHASDMSNVVEIERNAREANQQRVTEHLETADQKIADLEQSVTRIADLAQLMEAERATNADNHRQAREHLELTDSKVIDLEHSITELHGRIDSECDARAADHGATLGQLEGTQNKLAGTENKIVELEQSVVDLHGRFDQSSTDIHKHIDHSVADINEHIDHSTTELEGRVDQSAADLQNRIDESVNELHGRMDESVIELHGRVDESATELQGRIDESVNELRGRIDQVSQESGQATTSQLDELTDSISEQTTRLDAQIEAHSQVSQTVQYLEERAQATDDNHADAAARITEQVDQAHRRLDDGLSELAELRAGIDTDDRVAAEKDLTALEAKLDEQRRDQETLNRQSAEAERSLTTRVELNRKAIDTHSAILDATTQLIANHNDVAALSLIHI